MSLIKTAPIIIRVVILLFIFNACNKSGEIGNDENPNIIIINADDLGYGDLACYGSGLNKTPNLDKMAQEGMLLSSLYSASAMCSPSRASLLTGCYPQRVGFGRLPNQIGHVLLAAEPYGLHPYEITIPELLKEHGYNTQMVGKWHLGDQFQYLPTRQGFDHFFGLPYSHDIAPDHPLSEQWNLPPLPLMEDERVIQTNPDRSQLNQRFTERAIQFIRENINNSFFLYMALTIPHSPLLAPKEFLEKSANGPYGAYVELLDHCTGQILNELQRSGLNKNTLVIFTSDHGAAEVSIQPGSNGRLRGQKGQTFEGGMRVPAIMKWEGHIKPGSVCNTLVTQMDLLPTIASLVDAQLPNDRIIDGEDISMIFSEPETELKEKVFFYRWMDELHGVRLGSWKLLVKLPHQKPMASPLLYNLSEDIGEENNLAVEYPEVVEKLMDLLQEARNDLGDSASGIHGKNNRPLGWVSDARPLTKLEI